MLLAWQSTLFHVPDSDPVLPTQQLQSRTRDGVSITQTKREQRRRTCVAQRPLLPPAWLIVPPAGGRRALDVNLHAVLVVLLVVGLVVGPVLSLLGERLVGSHPGPFTIDLPDPDPVVTAIVRDDVVEVSNFIFVLDGHKVSVVLLAECPGGVPRVGLAADVIGPRCHFRLAHQFYGKERERPLVRVSSGRGVSLSTAAWSWMSV